MAPCPDRGEIAAFASGQAAPERTAWLESHLTTCQSCGGTLRELGDGDDLVAALREAGRGTIAPAVRAVIAEVAAWSPPATLTSDLSDTPSHLDSEEREALDALITKLLAPADVESDLGRLAHYRVLKVIGTGGMGIVFRALDTRLNRSVAIKVMRPDVTNTRAMVERFLREARTAAAVDHDNIVAIYEVGEDRGVPYIAMPLLTGATLEEWLVNRPTGERAPLSEVIRIGREIAAGLAAAHARGLIHRDIKPGNIWLDATAGNRVKILDFGLARPVRMAGEGGLTKSGQILGTPAYMDPTQARGGPVDARADLFSLGVILYRLCTGILPFRGPDALSILAALALDDPDPPHKVVPTVPRRLSNLVMQLLQKDPAKRVGSADEVIAVMRSLESGSAPAPPARRTGLWLALAALTAVVFAGIVLYYPTKSGTIRIEVNDDATKVALENGAILISGAGKEEIRVTPGEHALTIRRGEFEFTTDKFVLSKGQVTTLKVELVEGEVQIVRDGQRVGGKPAADEPAKSAAMTRVRKLATWILENGGGIEPILLRTNERIPMIRESSLIPAPDFRFTSIDLRPATDEKVKQLVDLIIESDLTIEWLYLDGDNPRFTAASLNELRRIPSLVGLGMQARVLRGADFAVVADLPKLAHLNIGALKVGDEVITTMANNRQLTEFLLNECNVTDAGMAKLGTMTWLRYIYCNSANLTDAVWPSLAQVKSLERLALQGDLRITGAGIERLSELPLAVIKLSNTGLNDAALKSLGKFTQLRDLEVSFTNITDGGLNHLTGSKLTTLDVRSTKVTAAGVKKLHAALPNCKINSDYGQFVTEPVSDPARRAAKWALGFPNSYLYVSPEGPLGSYIRDPANLPRVPFRIQAMTVSSQSRVRELDDAGLVGLAEIDDLPQLALFTASATDAGIARLAEFPLAANLSHLRLVNLRVGDPTLALLKRFPKLVDFQVESGPGVTDAGLKHFRDLPNLRKLIIIRCGVTDAGLAELVGSKIEDLALLKIPRITDAGMASLAQMPDLTRLELTSTGVGDIAASRLRALPKLRVLWIGDTAVTDTGMLDLGRMSELRELRLHQTRITGAGLAKITDLANLECLDLAQTVITDADLPLLAKFTKLQRLSLDGIAVTDAGLATLAKLSGLKSIDLSHTKVTANGVRKLADALKKCEIYSDHGSFEAKP